MNPAELRELSKLYKKKNELAEKQTKRISDLDIQARILETARKKKQELEQSILEKVKNGKSVLHYYDYYVVDTFLQDGSIDGCKRAAEKYETMARNIDGKDFHVNESACLYALHSLMQDGFVIRIEKRPFQTGSDVSAHELVIDWSCSEENDDPSTDFEKEAKSLRATIQKLKETDKLQEKLLLLEVENRALRQITNNPKKQDIYEIFLKSLPKK